MNAFLVPLEAIIALNSRLYTNCLADVSDEVARQVVAEQTSTMIFIALHCLDARIYMAETAGIEMVHPFPEFASLDRVEDIRSYPPIDSILKSWVDISGELPGRLEGLSTEMLMAPTQRHFPVRDRSVLGALSFLVQHESYHIGQLSLLRRLHGLPAMHYTNQPPGP